MWYRGNVVDGDNNSGGGMRSGDIYEGRVEPMLVSLSDSYSEEEISVCDSRPSSCSAYMSY